MKYAYLVATLVAVTTCISVNANSLTTELRNTCSTIKGTSFDSFNGCTCPVGEVYTFDRVTSEGRCEERRARSKDKICSSGLLGCLIQADKIDGDFFPLATGAALTFNAPDDKQDQVLEAIAQAPGNLFYWHPYSNYYLTGHVYVDIFNASSLNTENLNLLVDDLGLSDWPLAENRVTGRETDASGYIKLFSPDLEGALYLMGLKNTDRDVLDGAIPKSPTQTPENELQSIVRSAYQMLLDNRYPGGKLENSLTQNTVLIRGDSCFGICRSSSQLGAISNQYIVTYHHEILRGMVHKRFINIKKADPADNIELPGSIDIAIQLAPNLYPSYVLVRKYQEGGNGEITRTTMLYDRFGQSIVSDESTVLVSPTLNSKLQERQKARLNYQGPKMLLCEGVAKHTPEELKSVIDNLYIGPKQSIFGWTSPDLAPGTAEGFVSTLYYKELGTLGLGNENTAHLINTISSAKSVSPDIQIMPLGMPRCIATIDNWQPLADANNAKIVSISRTFLQSAETKSCKEGLLKKVTEKGADKLWVIAAGNDGKQNPEGYNCLNKTVEDNILTVAASLSDGTLERYSNFGLSHADIATSGSINGTNGTSFAAPRIASLAARLSNDFDSLSPKQIKLAILLGAEYKPALKSKLRSASYINFEKSEYADFYEKAYCINKAENQEDNDTCLGITRTKVCEGWWIFEECHTEVKTPDKIAFMKNNGLL